MAIEENEVYTTKEVANLLKVSLPTVKRMLKDGRLKSTRIGRQHRFLGKDILDILISQSDLREPVRIMAYDDKETATIKTKKTAKETPVKSSLSGEQSQKSFMIGKTIRSDIKDNKGNVVFSGGTIVTDKIITEAANRQILMELFSNLK